MLALLLVLQVAANPVEKMPHHLLLRSPAHHARVAIVSPGKVRHYYIAADEVAWNYVPSGKNTITGRAFDPFQQMFTTTAVHRIGSTFKKAIYREYTDATFKTLKPRAPQDEYLGLLGPVIRAEVGDSIKVTFKNNATYPYSMHPHGVLYDKSSEGAGYQDNTGVVQEGNAVQPGKTFTYAWFAGDRSGPGPMDGSSVLWMYHSHVNESADVNAGLIGALIVTARGMARPDGSPKDVDRELVVAFAELDENLSNYIDDNIKSYAGDPAGVVKPRGPTFIDPFGSTNVRESINGFLFGNGPVPTMKEGERVRWYLMSTTNFELHAPHWHGNIVTSQHMKTDVITLGTMGMVVADMIPDNPGTWLFHCHIEPHLTQGMTTRYTVLPRAVAKR